MEPMSQFPDVLETTVYKAKARSFRSQGQAKDSLEAKDKVIKFCLWGVFENEYSAQWQHYC